MPKVDEKLVEAQTRFDTASATLSGLVDADSKDSEALNAAAGEVQEAIKDLKAARKKPPTPPETAQMDDATATATKAEEMASAIDAEKKALKDAAKKAVTGAVQTQFVYTGDKEALEAALAEGRAADLPDKDLQELIDRLSDMVSFASMLDAATKDLVESAKGEALKLDQAKLEEKIEEHKEGAIKFYKKTICQLYLDILTKPSALLVATDALDSTLVEAVALEVDEAVVKAMKKKNEEAKKAQNAKKIADRKAKKPIADPPDPPEPPVPHPDAEVIEKALLSSMATAEAKLLESKCGVALVAAKKDDLLTADALLDLGERAADEVHPVIETLTAALKAAEEAKCEDSLLAEGKKALEDATSRRLAARTKLAMSKLQTAAEPKPIDCPVGDLGTAIGVAEKENVDETTVEAAKAHLAASYKAQSEGGLEPLSRPQELSHEGFQIIDPLKAALDEARKRGAEEDLIIKGQAKLDYWLEARTRRDTAKKELDASLKPPPATVDQPKVRLCLQEATEAKLDPVLLAAATDKLKVAELAQRVYAKSKANPGELAIAVLEDELEEVGGRALKVEQEKQAEMEAKVDELKEKIESIEETQTNQKQRDAQLAKQVKKGKLKQKDAKLFDPILPAWVKKEASDELSRIAGESPVTVGDAQGMELKELKDFLKVAEDALKAQIAVVKSMTDTVVVPQDVVEYAQLKLKASKVCEEMQIAQQPKLLALNIPRLQAAIKASEFKFGELPIKGLDDLDCNIPKHEIDKAYTRMRDAHKAQQRQLKARNQLQARVNAPTGTATFDLLVKLVAEAKAAEVEDEIIARAELKLKKMEELAASSLRAGPLAFVSFHLPCLRSCVSHYAISLVEQAEEKRKADFERAEAAKEALKLQIGTWQKGQITKVLLEVNIEALKGAITTAAQEGLSQELIEMGRFKLAAIDKYKIDKAKGLIKDDEPKEKKDDGDAPVKKKPKFKNYGYVAPEK